MELYHLKIYIDDLLHRAVCPFALNEGVEVYLDESLKQFETVFPACGATNNAIEISIEELEKVTNYKSWVDVSKPKEN